MCEFVGMDFEMEIKQHYHEVLAVLGDCMVSIFDEINKNCQKELAAVQSQYPFEPLKYRPLGQTLVIPFPEAVKMLKADGVQMGEFDDFTSVNTQAVVLAFLRRTTNEDRRSLMTNHFRC